MPKPPTYEWECLACRSGNPRNAISCSRCGCPASPTIDEINRFRPGYAEAVASALEHGIAQQKASKKALKNSCYHYWYWGSLAAYILSLAVPQAAGLYMLAVGWLAIPYSLAWLANPLLILAFVPAKPAGDPASSRWLAYSSLALMFATPVDGITKLWPFPFLPWIVSPALLVVGIERYRILYRKALSEEL